MSKGIEEGDVCGRDVCTGIIQLQKSENCSCHINPPCSSCTRVKLHCAACNWEAEEYLFNDHIVMKNTKTKIWEGWKLRPLDPKNIDWHSYSHTYSSMIKEGVYPAGTTKEEVLKVVNGTFGGRFEYFKDGKFKFIAYTD